MILPNPHLEDNEVHLWMVRSTDATMFDHCRTVLAHEELARADGFVFEPDRRMALISRGFRRLVLARYTRDDPRALRFVEDPFGKPTLSAGGLAIEFNVSHSGEVCVLAVTQGRAVGVDIERVRTDNDIVDIARHSYSAYEQRGLSLLPPHLRVLAFYRCWTQKEAFVKLLGAGLLHEDVLTVAGEGLRHYTEEPFLEDGDTVVIVRSGQAQISTPQGSTEVNAGDMATIRGDSSSAQYKISSAPDRDEWDTWNSDRDHAIAPRSLSAGARFLVTASVLQGGDELPPIQPHARSLQVFECLSQYCHARQVKRHVSDRFRRWFSFKQSDRHVLVPNCDTILIFEFNGQAERTLEPLRAAFWTGNRQSEMADCPQRERNFHAGYLN